MQSVESYSSSHNSGNALVGCCTANKEVIKIFRNVYRTKVPYARPVRYRTETQLVWIDEKGEHHRYFSERLKTFNEFVAWVKNKYGNERVYDVDYRKPTPIYVWNGNV